MNNINTIKNKKIFASIISFIIIFAAPIAFAVEYTYLAPGAFTGNANDKTSADVGLATFLGQVFNWGIAIAVVLALVMIIWGGIMYMTSDSWNKKEDGKDKIMNALMGLGLALASWLILYTINPRLVNFAGNKFLN